MLRLVIDESSGENRLRLVAARDDGTTQSSSPATVTAGWHAIELEWRSASTGLADGSLALYVDDVKVAELLGLDNDTLRIAAIRWGAVGFDDGTASGTIDMDNFSSRNDGHIGL